MKLLEVGSGNSPGTRQSGSLFRDATIEYTAIDISIPSQLHVTPTETFIEADATSMPFPSNTFYYILMRNFFGQFCDGSATPAKANRIFTRSLLEIRRVLKPLGRLAIVEEDTPLDVYDAQDYLDKFGFVVTELATMTYGTDNIQSNNTWKRLRSRYYSDTPAQSFPDEFLGVPYVLVAKKK